MYRLITTGMAAAVARPAATAAVGAGGGRGRVTGGRAAGAAGVGQQLAQKTSPTVRTSDPSSRREHADPHLSDLAITGATSLEEAGNDYTDQENNGKETYTRYK